MILIQTQSSEHMKALFWLKLKVPNTGIILAQTQITTVNHFGHHLSLLEK